MKKARFFRITLFLFFTILFQTNLISSNKDNSHKKIRKPIFLQNSENPDESIIDVGNITCWVANNGFHDWKASNNTWNGNFPNGSDAGVIFSEGIVWGGLVYDGQEQKVRVNGNVFSSGCKAITRLYRVRPDYKTGDLTKDAANFFLKPLEMVTKTDIIQLRKQYEKDWNEWPANEGANYKDVNGDGYYDPAVDIPGVPGAAQTIFIKYDDSNSNALYDSAPIGVEVKETYWAYDYYGALGNVIFKKVDLIYKGTSKSISNSHIDSMYINQWAETDLGYPLDDFSGCDTTLNLGYTYNSSENDKVYTGLGMIPPAAGYNILQGVSKYKGNQSDSAMLNLKWRKGYKYVNRKPMSTFIFDGAGNTWIDPPFNYQGALEYYNLMRGKFPTQGYPVGLPFPKNYGTITPYGTYLLDGDPVTGTGIIDGIMDVPSDRRIWLMTGPFKMNLNDTAEVVIALVVGQGSSYLNSITRLKENDRKVQKFFDRAFKIPNISPPEVDVTNQPNKVILNWGSNQKSISSVENFADENYNFEGYEVYQLPSAKASLDEGIKIGGFDLRNGVTAIYDTVRDVNGVNIPKLQLSGKDNGITRYIEVTRDSLRQSVLYEGQTYYFAVVSYAYNKSPIFPFHLIRSPIKVVEASPQTAAPGVRYEAAFGDTLQSIHFGQSEGSAIPIVIDPTKTDGKTYKVTFDTLNNGIVWNLKEKSSGKAVLTNMKNETGNNNYPIVNGILPKVISPPIGIKKVSYSGDRWIFAIDWGGSQFFGGMDIGTVFWKDAHPMYDYVPIELRFTGGIGKETPSEANGWSQGAVYRKDKGYAYEGIGWMPFTAWDVSDSLNPKQVNISFVEDSLVGNVNLKWDMGWDGNRFASQGGNEYIIISNTTYDPYYYNEENIAMQNKNMYDIWPYTRIHKYLEASFTMLIKPNMINLPSDVFEFTAPYVIKNKELAKTDVEKVNVFPNPYYTYQKDGIRKNTGYITFNHLPEYAVIRIFDLSGVLVKTIKHEHSNGQLERWNLRNDNNLQVASGIFIVYINMPGLNKTKIIKLAVVQ